MKRNAHPKSVTAAILAIWCVKLVLSRSKLFILVLPSSFCIDTGSDRRYLYFVIGLILLTLRIPFSAMAAKIDELISEFPPGPLDEYRKKASFDWRKLKLFLEGEERIRYEVSFDILQLRLVLEPFAFQNQIYGIMAKDPIFSRPPTTPSLEENRNLTFKRLRRLHEYGIVCHNEVREVCLRGRGLQPWPRHCLCRSSATYGNTKRWDTFWKLTICRSVPNGT